VCCSVLQCSVLQCGAVLYSVLQLVQVILTNYLYYLCRHRLIIPLQHAAICCNLLQLAATCCNLLQHSHSQAHRHIAAICSMSRNNLQHTATHCNSLRHTATHCNTLQHTATHSFTGTSFHCGDMLHDSLADAKVPCLAVCCNALQHITTCYSVL